MRKEATVQAAARQLMMHSPEYARAWMAHTINRR
jgi:hypothetical protein